MRFWEMLAKGRKALEEAKVFEYESDAFILFEYVTGLDRGGLLLKKEEEVPEAVCRRYLECVNDRCSGRPVQHITGHAPFFGLDFLVNENVLIPRFDTEVLVETVMENLPRKPKLEILDMCTGSGCIAVSIERALSDKGIDGRVTGSDVSGAALDIARQNADRNGAKVDFVLSDVFENIEGSFDVIISNPPYIRSAEVLKLEPVVRDYEPKLALDGTSDGLFFYRKITGDSVRYIKDKGLLFYEIGYDQGEDVMKIMSEAGYKDIEILKDLAGLDRVIWGRYC